MNIDKIKKVCVIGWGRSGRALGKLLLSLKKKVCVSDILPRDKFSSLRIDKFKRQGVDFEFGGHSEKFIKDSQLVVVSPGVNTANCAAVEAARQLGVLCMGEIEFASCLTPARLVAITGTNGKTTTTFLTYQALRQKIKKVFLGGNIGIPLSLFALKAKAQDVIVLEMSSFQLETIVKFRPYVAALLNFAPDHLDRYARPQDYFEAKMNIFKNQKEDDWAVLNRGLDSLADIERRIKARKVFFDQEFSNENYSCVWQIVKIFDLDEDDCRRVFSSFRGLPHRLQFVCTLDGVTFINDSKATNPASAIWALKNTNTAVIIVAGGRDKGLDFGDVLPFLKKVKKINLFGEAAYKMKKVFNPHIATEIFSNLEDSVAASFKQAQAGDTVLFSPMCASFDMFSDYRQRGRRFIEIVNNISSR